ncbi:helix-turn-helix transcriptional regulator [Macrococcus equipercicus]|uniref:Helix-turn-helix transcriptional regulator n=1 Tax=Macrococcus equipercicus TaxID=69967 RepID=A0ABQ6R7I9_9STAP|nr:helix-turn-helix transcriptional regulator [Macrococcus equipercicus]KAA1039068.1 helix-turn-helix transcriptional regulator [Macrococcus equipercicus]
MEFLFCENVGKILVIKKITQNQLAKESNLSRQTISKISSCSQNIQPSFKLSTCISVAWALDVNFSSMFSRFDVDESFLRENKFIDDNYLEIFKNNLESISKKRFQKSLSASPGASESTLSELLTGKTIDPTLRTLIKISETVDQPLEKLFTRGGIKI